MQKLRTKRTSPSGKEEIIILDVLRSWQGTAGHIFLIRNGDYVYKNGQLCTDEALIKALINVPVHQKAALKWLSQLSKTDEVSELPAVAEGLNHLDYARYFRTLPGKTRPDGPSVTWMPHFDDRPDWWGHADRITIAGVTWELDTEPIDSDVFVPADDEPKPKPKAKEVL